MADSWRGYLTRIGDRCAEYAGQDAFDDQLETCLSVLTRELDRYDDDIADVLLQCVEEIPHKQPLYGTLVGLFNVEEPEFVAKIVRRLHTGLQAALETDNCNMLRLLLRFLAVVMCSNVISTSTLVEVFEVLLSNAATTVDEDGGNPAWQPRADFYVFCILASLPWCGLELVERAPEELDRVMAAIEAYFSLRIRAEEYSLRPFNTDPSADKTSSQDFMQDLWGRVRELQQGGWKTDSILRPYLSCEARLAPAQTSHQVGALTCPDVPKPYSGRKDVAFGKQIQEAEAKFGRRAARLQIFPSEKSEKNMVPIDRFLIEEYLLDIMFYFNGSRKECAAFMAGLRVPFRYEYVMAETIFAQMLMLPRPPFKLIYYTIVIMDLCKALPGAFPTVIGGAVRGLFDMLGDLDAECQSRLVQWMSHHLSNFQFAWQWEDWVYVLELPIWSPQRVFVQEVLEKSMRLSYLERVKQSLDNTPALYDMLPSQNTPCFKYNKDQEGFEAGLPLHNDLSAQIRAKKSLKEIHAWFETKVLPSSGQTLAVEVLVQTLLNLGSKSFTHMVTVLEKYGQLISKLAADQALQVLVVEEVATFWQNSSQMIAIIVDRMMNYRLISNLAIATWAFSNGNTQTFHTSNRVWEVLQTAISKTINRTNDLHRDIEAAKKTLEEANAAAVKAETSRANVQSLIESADTDEAQRQATARMEWVKTMIEKAKDRQVAAEDLLETKEALIARALKEQETLFLSVFRSFASVVTERMSSSIASASGESAMEVDADTDEQPGNGDDNERRNERSRNPGKGSKEEELKQWLRCTIGNLQSISRRYSTEVWQLLERLDSEVFTEQVNAAVPSAVYAAIRRV